MTFREGTSPNASRSGAALLRVIAVFKLIKAAVLLASLATVFDLIRHGDPVRTAISWAMKLHVDPNSNYLRAVLATISGLDRTRFELVEIGTGLYAFLFLTEGIGLWLARSWAEYLTAVATAGFIPIEVYEFGHRPSATKAALLGLNVTIVLYLAMRARRRLAPWTSTPLLRQ